LEYKTEKKKIVSNIYELDVALEDKVYLKMYFSHQLGCVAMNETPTKIKA
jgi:hypothetical protein